MGLVTSQCVHCNQLVSVDTVIPRASELRCSFCGTRQIQHIYPAFAQEPASPQATLFTDEGASCYFHEAAAAANVCDDCGRYLCELCTLPIPMPASMPPDFPERVCPACFENRTQQELRDQQWDLFRTKYTRHDIIATFLIVMPMVFPVFIVFTFITIPVAMYIIIRNWNTSHTPLKPLRGRLLFVLFVGLVGITIWLSILGFSVAGVL